jgi:hypothetical protein
MATYPPPGPEFGSRLDEALRRIETELRHAVDFMNDAVVPKVRKESITAMRNLAETLRGLADRLETGTGSASHSGKDDRF